MNRILLSSKYFLFKTTVLNADLIFCLKMEVIYTAYSMLINIFMSYFSNTIVILSHPCKILLEQGCLVEKP